MYNGGWEVGAGDEPPGILRSHPSQPTPILVESRENSRGAEGGAELIDLSKARD